MRNSINIVEVCSEGSISKLLDYDLLPFNVKLVVDQAFAEEEKSLAIDINEDGLQFLFDYQDQNQITNLDIEIGEPVINMGTVYLYDRNY